MAAMVTCWVCGKEHEYCPTCDKVHGWKYVADTHEHYQVYMIIEEYRNGVYTKEEAAKVLNETCGIKAESDLSWMLPNVEKGVREIIGKSKKYKSNKKK